MKTLLIALLPLLGLVGCIAWMLAKAEREARERDAEARRFVEDD